MFFTSKRLIERSEGLEMLAEILKDKSRSIIIHYSCESFITTDGRTPRVTSISIRYLNTGQTKSFSIHLQAQFNNQDLNNLANTEYDAIEKTMLEDFYVFVNVHKQFKWIHWNMRDSNYGFEAIANRYRILGGTPIEIDPDRRYDLPRILAKLYTYEYENNEPDGKLLNLAKRNGITIIDAIKGLDEANAFENEEYLKLHKSSLRKVDIVETIIDKADKRELKVNVGKMAVYGLSVPGIIEITKSNWLLQLLWTIIIYLLGVFTTEYIQSVYNTVFY